MNLFSSLLQTLASVISIYSTICFVRIIFTWIPSLEYSRFGAFLAKICDPFLSMFSGIKFMRFNNIDFSPILAFAVLSGISQILLHIARTGKLRFSYVLAIILNLAWGIVNSLITILFFLLLLRLILLLVNKSNSSNFWIAIDSIIFKMTRPVIDIFAKGKFISLTATVSIALAETVVAFLLCLFVIKFLCFLVLLIPF